jgi:hypothetical protein
MCKELIAGKFKELYIFGYTRYVVIIPFKQSAGNIYISENKQLSLYYGIVLLAKIQEVR